jgi:phosphoribosyl 1,2-cyclic phosphodiesterase
MALQIISLNSGSNGNCYYIGSEQEAVLIDAGISCRETEKRMKRAGLSMALVKAIFISHEHSDHIRGVEVLSRKYSLPVYITGATLNNSRLSIDPNNIRSFSAHIPEVIGSLSVLPFPKFHDASDPHSFVVSGGGINVGVFTDIGAPCKYLTAYFKHCHAAFLEANYDQQMLEQGGYPYYLKKRIKSDTGHLSNDQALKLFLEHKPEFMTHVLLSHLSKDNNDPDLVRELFTSHSGSTRVIVASRYKESEVFRVTAGGIAQSFEEQITDAQKPEQLCLF